MNLKQKFLAGTILLMTLSTSFADCDFNGYRNCPATPELNPAAGIAAIALVAGIVFLLKKRKPTDKSESDK
jgi:hypothetical protein